jgi:hypothetical protein
MKVSYKAGVIRINYGHPLHDRICENIQDTRIELANIREYAKQCQNAEDFFQFSALAEMVQKALTQMVKDFELSNIPGDIHASNLHC